jgi:hypothetical protein
MRRGIVLRCRPEHHQLAAALQRIDERAADGRETHLSCDEMRTGGRLCAIDVGAGVHHRNILPGYWSGELSSVTKFEKEHQYSLLQLV